MTNWPLYLPLGFSMLLWLASVAYEIRAILRMRRERREWDAEMAKYRAKWAGNVRQT